MEVIYKGAVNSALPLTRKRIQNVSTSREDATIIALPIERGGEQYGYLDKPVYEVIKRILDIVLSIIGLVVTSPIMLITAIAIKCEDGGPVIHKRICVGRNNNTYVMYKFRSMVVNANDLDQVLTPEQKKQYMKELKIEEDPRVTNVGRFIRKTSIDELPQLVTILKGDMSIVGPRPMVAYESLFFNEYADMVLLARPGLTGYWQVYGRSNKKYETGERQKMELYYITHRSLWFDLKLIFKTIVCVLRGDGN